MEVRVPGAAPSPHTEDILSRFPDQDKETLICTADSKDSYGLKLFKWKLTAKLHSMKLTAPADS